MLSKKHVLGSIFIVLCNINTAALAIVQGNLQFGVRSVDQESQSVQSISVLADPLPLVPLAVGIKTTQLPNSQSETAAEIQAWVPMLPLITPFVYVDVLIQSSVTAGKQTGQTIGFGIEKSFVPFVSATISIESGNRRFSPSDSSLSETTSNYLGLMIGVQTGI